MSPSEATLAVFLLFCLGLAIALALESTITAFRKRQTRRKAESIIPHFNDKQTFPEGKYREITFQDGEVCNGIMVGAVTNGPAEGVVLTLTKDKLPYASLIMPYSDADEIAMAMMQKNAGRPMQ